MKLRKLANKFCRSLLVLILTTSCYENTFYHSYQPVNQSGWYKSDTLSYILPTPTTSENLSNIQIGIRHKDSYPYRDLWLKINEDTVHLYLADSIGNWLGSGIGEIRHLSSSISMKVSNDSIKSFHIVHIMKDNPLIGIHDIGVHLQSKD